MPWAAREKDGQLDWQKLFASQPEKAPAKNAEVVTVEAPKAAPVAPSKPWAVLLKDVDLRDYRVHLADNEPKTPVALDVGPLNVNLKNFDSLNRSPFTLNLDTGVGKQGKLTASGDVNLSPASARAQITLATMTPANSQAPARRRLNSNTDETTMPRPASRKYRLPPSVAR